MSKYYDNVDTMPMSAFITAMCDDNLDVLVYEGDVSDVHRFVLEDAWSNIKEQYADRIGNFEQKQFIKLMREVNSYVATLSQLSVLFEQMEFYYCDQFGSLVNKLLQVDIKWVAAYDWEAYLKQLQTAKNRVAGIEMKMDLKRIALEQLQNKLQSRGDSAAIDRAYYSRLFNLMEEHYSVQMSEDIKVGRFCDRLNRMVKDSRNQKSKHHGRSAR